MHLSVAVEHHDAVGCGIEDVADLADLRLGVAQRRLEGLLPVVAARLLPTPVSISTSADSPSHGEVNSRASTGT